MDTARTEETGAGRGSKMEQRRPAYGAYCPYLKSQPGVLPTIASDRKIQVGGPPFDIFIRAGHTIKKTVWQGGNDEALQNLCFETYHIQNRVRTALPVCSLYNSLAVRSTSDGYQKSLRIDGVEMLSPGAVVEIINPLWKSLFILSGYCNGLPAKVKAHIEKLDTWQSEEDQQLSFQQRANLFLNEPTSSRPAMLLAIIIMLLIFISTVVFCIETLPEIYYNGNEFTVWMTIETICIACFTLEIALRFAFSEDRSEFCQNTMNIIDFVSILPFYLELIFSSIEVPGLSVLRVMRLSRVFRLLKVSRDSIVVLAETLKKSSKPLYILIFLSSLAMVLFASLMYYCERGSYDKTLGVWMHTAGWSCPYECTSVSLPECPEVGALATTVYLHKTGDYKSECVEVKTQSAFDSIPISCWWALVTMTTVGYGDMQPESVIGKALGMITQMFGILVIALPVTIIGSNFTAIYERALEDKVYQRRILSSDPHVFATDNDDHFSTPWKRPVLKALQDRVIDILTIIQKNA